MVGFDNRLVGDPVKSSFTNEKGIKIATYFWESTKSSSKAPKSPAPILLFIHGIRSHGRRDFLGRQGTAVEDLYAAHCGDVPVHKYAEAMGFQAADLRPFALEDKKWMQKVTLSKASRLSMKKDTDGERTSTSSTASSSHKSKSKKYDEGECKCDCCSGKYEPRNLSYEGGWTSTMNDMGFAVASHDIQGHGESGGWGTDRCNVEDFDHYATDVIQHVKILLEMQNAGKIGTPGGGVCVFGFSLGGCIVARAAQLLTMNAANTSTTAGFQTPEESCALLERIRAFVLIGPMLDLTRITSSLYNRMMMPFAKLLSAMAPNVGVVELVPNPMWPWATADSDIDPLCFNGKLAARMARECVRGVEIAHRDAVAFGASMSVQQKQSSGNSENDHAQVNARSAKSPRILVCHSRNDTLCDPTGVIQWFDTVQRSYEKDIRRGGVDSVVDADLMKFWLVDEMWHMMASEPYWKELCTKVGRWMLECNDQGW